MGLPLIHIGTGAFRKAYRIGKMRLVVKIPHNKSAVEHAQTEMRMIRRLKRRVPSLMPKVVFYNQRNGVMVLKKYDTSRVREYHAEQVEMRLGRLKLPCGDVHTKNVAFEGRRLKVIDLGCFNE